MYVLIFFLGAAIGSFACVIADRLYIKSAFSGRSECASCAKKLAWYEMVPVFSFIFIRGRCTKCKSKIGARHFWVEIMGGIFSILVYSMYIENYFSMPIFITNIATGILFSILFALLFITFTVIFIYDLRHKLVPTKYTLLLIITGLAFELFRVFNYKSLYGGFTTLFWLDLFSGFFIALPFLALYYLSGKKGVGFGDILIFFGVGYVTGFVFGVSVFLLSVWIGALTSVLLMYLYPKKYNRKSRIPFAPFIVIATTLVLFLQIDIVGILPLFR